MMMMVMMTIVNDSSECSVCTLSPPPDMILRLPPPPLPSFLLPGPDFFGTGASTESQPLLERSRSYNVNVNGSSSSSSSGSSPCRHSCEWHSAEGVQYVEMPQQGTVFDDTWLIVLISACVGIIFIGIILTTFMFKCKMEHEVAQPNDDASQCSNRSNKNSTLSTSTASSGAQTTTTSGGLCSGRGCGLPHLRHPLPEPVAASALLYPACSNPHSAAAAAGVPLMASHPSAPTDPVLVHDPRVMWATLTPRGTTRHYLEEHTYETIGGGDLGVPPQPLTPPSSSSASHGSNLSLGPPGHHQHHYQHHHHHHHHRPVSSSFSSHDTGPREHVNLKSHAEPRAPSPGLLARPSKSEKAFDNTAFVDYEEPLTMKSGGEYCQLDESLEQPCEGLSTSKYGSLSGVSGAGDGGGGGGLEPSNNPSARLPVFSVQGLYGMHHRSAAAMAAPDCTLRPRVSSPTRIEHPNLPPLNLQPTLPRSRHRQRKSSFGQLHQQQQQQYHYPHPQHQQHQHHRQHHQQEQQQQPHVPDCTLPRSGRASSAYTPTI